MKTCAGDGGGARMSMPWAADCVPATSASPVGPRVPQRSSIPSSTHSQENDGFRGNNKEDATKSRRILVEDEAAQTNTAKAC